MTLQATKPITADELLAMGDLGRCELIKGEIIRMAPAGFEHGGVEGDIFRLVANFVEAGHLGVARPSDTGFIIGRNPDTVRAPDVAFIRKERLPKGPRRGFFDGAPDLAVEVISPSDSWSEVLDKVNDWLAAGTISVWVADPPSQSIHVYHTDQQAVVYKLHDELRDETVLPGFVLKLTDVFRQP